MTLVPRFEGEEDNQCETTDLLVAEYHPSQIEFPVVEVHRTFKSMFNRVMKVPTSVLNPAECSAKFLQGLETCYDVSVTHILRFELFSVGGTYKKGQRGVIDLEKGRGLTIIDTVHLERPPSNVFMFVKPPTIKILDRSDFAPEMSHEKAEELLPFVTNVPGSCVKFSKGAEARCEAWAWMFLLFRHFGLMWSG